MYVRHPEWCGEQKMLYCIVAALVVGIPQTNADTLAVVLGVFVSQNVLGNNSRKKRLIEPFHGFRVWLVHCCRVCLWKALFECRRVRGTNW